MSLQVLLEIKSVTDVNDKDSLQIVPAMLS